MIINKYKWIILSYNISNLQGAHTNRKIKLRKIDTHKASSILVQENHIFQKMCFQSVFYVHFNKRKEMRGFRQY